MRIRGYKEEIYEMEGEGLEEAKATKEAKMRWVLHGDIVKTEATVKEGGVNCYRFIVRTLLFTQER